MKLFGTIFLLVPSLLLAQANSESTILNKGFIQKVESLLAGKEINEYSAQKYYRQVKETPQLKEENVAKAKWSLYVAKSTVNCNELEAGLVFTRYHFFSLNQKGKDYLSRNTEFKKITSFDTLAQAFSYPTSVQFYVGNDSSTMEYSVAYNSKENSWSAMGSTSQSFGNGGDNIDGIKGYCSYLKEAPSIVLKKLNDNGSFVFTKVKDQDNFLFVDFNSTNSFIKVSRIFAYPDYNSGEWKSVTAMNEFKK
jgi:hypothetical protein